MARLSMLLAAQQEEARSRKLGILKSMEMFTRKPQHTSTSRKHLQKKVKNLKSMEMFTRKPQHTSTSRKHLQKKVKNRLGAVLVLQILTSSNRGLQK
ncbi:hypothetical protein QE152_g7793 [Popillia japonica]|uniref:Uncharacterized protein n=1 Tax=Popillia japonica TaxID=7064 RepID=A0AAW1MD12_POPJA